MTDQSNPYNFGQAWSGVQNLPWQAPSVNVKSLTDMMQPATKQQASTGKQATTPPGQIDPTAAQRVGQTIGEALNRYRMQMQAYGGAQGQRPGMPMQIVPQNLQPQPSVAPANNPGSPFGVTGGLY